MLHYKTVRSEEVALNKTASLPDKGGAVIFSAYFDMKNARGSTRSRRQPFQLNRADSYRNFEAIPGRLCSCNNRTQRKWVGPGCCTFDWSRRCIFFSAIYFRNVGQEGTAKWQLGKWHNNEMQRNPAKIVQWAAWRRGPQALFVMDHHHGRKKNRCPKIANCSPLILDKNVMQKRVLENYYYYCGFSPLWDKKKLVFPATLHKAPKWAHWSTKCSPHRRLQHIWDPDFFESLGGPSATPLLLFFVRSLDRAKIGWQIK